MKGNTAKTLTIVAIGALLLNAGCASLPVSKVERAPAADSALHFEKLPEGESVSHFEQLPEANSVSHSERDFDAQGDTENQEEPAQEREARVGLSPFMFGVVIAGGFVFGLFLLILAIDGAW